MFRYLQYIITWCKQRRASSSLTRRILAINLLVLIVPVGGFFFLESYQKRLIESEIESLKVQAEIFAGAVGALATKTSPILGHQIIPIRANIMLHRLTSITNTRVRLYGSNGTLMADTQLFPISRGAVLIDELPPPDSEIGPGRWFVNQINNFLNWIPGQNKLPLYIEANPSNAENFKEVKVALFGEQAAAVRRHEPNGLIISVALPVQHYRQVIGALMVSNNGHKIEQAMRAIRLDILKIFTIALIITILLSLYLAGTIARPINRLAAAAEKVRTGHGRHVYIPDFTSRRDEIGELSRDLRGMTEALWQRMDAIEKFAADVYAHKSEILDLLHKLKSDGKKIVAYGMSGRGNTLLNFWNVGTDIIDYGIDASPERYDRYVPGMHIPIKPPQNSLENVDYALLLAWIFKDDIMKKENIFTNSGGKFIIPMPKPHFEP